MNCIIRSDKSEWDGLPKSKSLFTTNKGCGLPIGNLTSQLFSNIFLNVFDHYVVGNPYSSHGFLCNPPVEVNAVKKYFSEINESNCSVLDLTGTSFENLLDYISQNKPVVIWCSINLVEPIRRHLYNSEYYTPSHAVVLSGYNLNTGKVTLTDSISGVVEADFERVKYLYNLFGKKSLVLR